MTTEHPSERVEISDSDGDHLPRWLVALQLLGGGIWIALVTWRLSLVPGMSMDEGWSIVAARGQFQPANPLSGMSGYTGALPVLLLDLCGDRSGLLALRGASVLIHAVTLVSIARMLRRHGRRALAGWALPLIATSPTWLISIRTGIEVTMFTAPLAVLGLYLTTRGAGLWAFAAGVIWGLLIYNHLLGLWIALAFAVAWLVVYRRSHPLAWRPMFAGFAIGISPRLLAMALYDNAQITDTAAALSPAAAFRDLLYLPEAVWDTLHARPVYLRYVGRLAEHVQPYWLLGIVMLLPWVRLWRQIPRPALFTLVAFVSTCILTTLGAPYLEVRFLVLPAIAFPAALVLFGARAIELDSRWAHVIRATAAALVSFNVYYVFTNFYQPWYRRELGQTSYQLGQRGRPVGSWHFLPKDELTRQLSSLEPRPEQVVSHTSLTRSLLALMDGTGIRVVEMDQADRKARSVFVDYRRRHIPPRYCIRAMGGRMCFARPTVVDNQFVVYLSSR